MPTNPTNESVAMALGITGDWYCPTCKEWVIAQDVTYQECHDERANGCGNTVQPMPDFTTSDPAAVEWVLPEIMKAKCTVVIEAYRTQVYDKHCYVIAEGEKVAPTLCTALHKLRKDTPCANT